MNSDCPFSIPIMTLIVLIPFFVRYAVLECLEINP